ncbi:MAG: tetratricopeptide repeat protein [Magnetococcus sp. MYC-9]
MSDHATAAALFAADKVGEALLLGRQLLAEQGPQVALLELMAFCHLRLGDPLQAISCWQQAITLQPEDADLWYNLALLLQEQRQDAQAEQAFCQAIARRSGYAAAYNNLGVLWLRQQRAAEAEQAFRRALSLAADYAGALQNLAILLQRERRFAEAEESFRQLLRLQPERAEVHNTLGLLLHEQRRFAEAEQAFRQAIALQPEQADYCNNLGLLLQDCRQTEAAEALFRHVLFRQPECVGAYCNLGNLLKELRRDAEAESLYRQALQHAPDAVEARWNLSLLQLAQGRFAEGWPGYETRHHPHKQARQTLPIEAPFPFWQGEPLRGKSLLILPEQGFGDQIQFCRYVASLRAMGVGWVTLVCRAPLRALFASLAGVDRVWVEGQEGPYPPHDFWTFYLSLPLHCGTTLATIPAQVPYLTAPAERLASWSARLPAQGFRVGLVWKGNPQDANDADRSLPGLALLAPLWSVPGVRFVSLQKGSGEEEAGHPPPEQPLLALGQMFQDFADTAAVVLQLDLVISIDSAVVHLAGALGKPCWVLLPAWETDWRWLRDRTDSPWYPGLRLFRQKDGWPDLIQQVTEALREHA